MIMVMVRMVVVVVWVGGVGGGDDGEDDEEKLCTTLATYSNRFACPEAA